MAGLVVTGGTVARAGGPQLVITPAAGASSVKLTLPAVAPAGPNQTTRFDILADADPTQPSSSIVRLVNVAYSGAGYPSQRQTITAGNTWFTTLMNGSGNAGARVRLAFYADTAAPIRLRQITTYDAPAVAFRAFDNGAVFLNPSPHPHTVDVATLAPGRSFVRLTATDRQDGTTNNGSPIGGSLTIPAMDALVVRNA
jgi:hypothetical protein